MKCSTYSSVVLQTRQHIHQLVKVSDNARELSPEITSLRTSSLQRLHFGHYDVAPVHAFRVELAVLSFTSEQLQLTYKLPVQIVDWSSSLPGTLADRGCCRGARSCWRCCCARGCCGSCSWDGQRGWRIRINGPGYLHQRRRRGSRCACSLRPPSRASGSCSGRQINALAPQMLNLCSGKTAKQNGF